MSEVRSLAHFTIHLRSPSSTNSAINKLHNEILLLIFLINSRIEVLSPMDQEKAYQSTARFIDDEKGPLINNRHASQVCRRWRGLALSSSTLWANALEIHNLCQKSDFWRNLVLQRTGNAFITLSGLIQYGDLTEGLAAVPFVSKVLKEHWRRVKTVATGTGNGDVLDQLRLAIQLPAPSLQHFSVITPCDVSLSHNYDVLFADRSPSLRSIFFNGLDYRFLSGWAANIRQWWVTGNHSLFSFREIYAALRGLPRLESLFIDHSSLAKEEIPRSHRPRALKLPHLTDITVTSIPTGSFLLDLLRLIVPAEKCQFVICTPSDDELTDYESWQMSGVLCAFLKLWSNFEKVNYLSLGYTKSGGFSIQAEENHGLPTASYALSFKYAPRSYIMREKLVDFATPIFNALSFNNVEKVRFLSLSLDSTLLDPADSHLHGLLQRLISVTTLRCTAPTLRVLAEAQNSIAGTIFSKLEDLVMIDVNPKSNLTRFLVRRMMRRAPVRRLDIPLRRDEDADLWELLEGIDDLEITRGGCQHDVVAPVDSEQESEDVSTDMEEV